MLVLVGLGGLLAALIALVLSVPLSLVLLARPRARVAAEHRAAGRRAPRRPRRPRRAGSTPRSRTISLSGSGRATTPARRSRRPPARRPGDVPAVAVRLDHLGRAAGRADERGARAASPTAASRSAARRRAGRPRPRPARSIPSRACARVAAPCTARSSGIAHAVVGQRGRVQVARDRHLGERPVDQRRHGAPLQRRRVRRGRRATARRSSAGRPRRAAAPSRVGQRERRAPHRQAGQEVVRAVDRVDVPGARRRTRDVPSSPTTPSSGRSARSRVAISSSAAWSAADTTSDTEVLCWVRRPSRSMRAASWPASRTSAAARARSSTRRRYSVDVVLVEVGELLAHHVLLDLAGRGLRQLVDDDHRLRRLEPGDAGASSLARIACSSSVAPGLATTTAVIASVHRACGSPTTATSAMSASAA